MAIAGLRGTGDWGTDERPKNFREMILWRNPNGKAPLTALMARMSKKGTDDPEFAWWEEEQNPIRLQVNDGTGLNTTDTTVVVDNGLNSQDAEDLVAGDLLLVETAETDGAYAHEIIEVSSVTNSTTFEAVRGAAGTTAANIADDTFLTKIGNTFAEGTTSPTVSSRNPTKLFNYCQIFKTAYELTNTAKVTNARTGDAEQNDKRRKMFDHSVAIEYAMLFGARNETTGSNGKPQRTMGGLLNMFNTYDATRIVVKGSAYTGMNGILDDVYDVFDYNSGETGGDERIIFAGNGAINAWNKAAAADGTINYTDTIKVFGMNFQKFVTPQGTFFLKSHPLMNVHGRFTNSMFIIDPPSIRWRPLRDTKFEDNIQANDSDTTKGQWITEAGVEFNHLKTMKFISNISF